jgi:tRNA 2-thiouridine synthesizing protein A
MEEKFNVCKVLDLRGEVCPFTFVKSKLAVEEMKVGEILEVTVDHIPAIESVPRSLEGEGQEILRVKQASETEWKIIVRKKVDVE